MLVNRLAKYSLCFCLSLYGISCMAAAFSIVPKLGTTLPTAVVIGKTVKAYYTVRNETSINLSNIFVKYLPQNVVQVLNDSSEPLLCGKNFSLKAKGFCTLELEISGSVNAGDPNPQHHLFVCHPQIKPCAGTQYPLQVKGIEPTISGIVSSGPSLNAKALAGVDVELYAANQQGSQLIAQDKTNNKGEFFLLATKDMTGRSPVYYLIAQDKKNIRLATIIGRSLVRKATINELTTVASAFSMAQFFQQGLLMGKPMGLDVASQMAHNLVDVHAGELARVIKNSPNADQTNTQRSLSSLANLILPCVRDEVLACKKLYAATQLEAGVQNTLNALLKIAHHPANQVISLYQLSKDANFYTPFLNQAPDAWTLAVKFHHSGDDTNCPFGGPGGLVQDDNGYIWSTNNVVQGTPNSAICMIVLKPNGQPADGKYDTPKSPIYGGGLLGGGFGITIAQDKSIWEANFGWGSCDTCIPNGSVSQFTPRGFPVSGLSGYQSKSPNDLDRVQGIVSDTQNNIWMASFGNNKVVVYRNGKPNDASGLTITDMLPFALAIAKNGDAWVTSARVRQPYVGILHLNSDGSLKLTKTPPFGSSMRAIVFDSKGNAWVASVNDNKVYQLSPDGRIIQGFQGGGVAGPWGLAVDANDQIWVGNFEASTKKPINFSVSQLCGVQTKTCPDGAKAVGAPISPDTGYTLPSAGQQVLLANGEPLKGAGAKPSYNPLMRQTFVLIDSAGNVWVTNNWKVEPVEGPSIPGNLKPSGLNPGGDGVVAFVGLAKPYL